LNSMIETKQIETKQLHRQRGFTMIEMIGVLAVIAILASIVAPKIFDAIRDSKVNAFTSNIQAVQTAVSSYYKDVGSFPTAAGDLISSTNTNWKGPYLDKPITEMFSSLPQTGAVTLTAEAPSATANFDLDGNASGDYTSKSSIAQLTFTGMAVADAKAVSGSMDGDDANIGDAASGKWYNMGRFLHDTYTTAVEPTASTDYRAYIGAL